MRVSAVVLDWAGTTVDHGSRAPAATLLGVFAAGGIEITMAEARQFMGVAKREHIASILKLPRVAGEWERVHGEWPGPADLDRLYAGFVARQLASLAEHSDVIEGVAGAVDAWRGKGIRIGSTTGYTRPMLELLLEHARTQGFSPDAAACPEDVPGGGRPGPWMCYRNAILLERSPLWTMVKIGDTPADVEEGLNAGMWTIGVTRTGNEVGLTVAEWEALAEDSKREALHAAEQRLRRAGAHFAAQSVGDCVAIVEEIDARLEAGQRP